MGKAGRRKKYVGDFCEKCAEPLIPFVNWVGGHVANGGRGKQYICTHCKVSYDKGRECIGKTKADRLLQLQGGFCGVCFKKLTVGKNAALDHDHLTGRVRGFLCYGCNTALGKLGDDVDGLYRAIEYLTFPPADLIRNQINPLTQL